MLTRDTNGNIVNIKRADFITDSDYYKQLSLLYGVNLNNLTKINTISHVTTKDKVLECIKNM